jgi:hypothetical protein
MPTLPYNPELGTLEFKVEVALVKFLITAGLDPAVLFTGEEAELTSLPRVICKCPGGPETPPGSNSFLEDVEVCIVSTSDLSNSNADPMPLHRRLLQEVRGALWNSKVDASGQEWLHSFLSCQVPYFSVMREIEFDGGSETSIRDRHIMTDMRFRMHCNEQPGLPDALADYLAGRFTLGQLPEDLALLQIFAAAM